MKRIILIYILIFTGIYSQKIVDFSDKTMKNKYLKKEDFKYFEYDLSDCKMSDKSKKYRLELNDYILEFNLNENNQPDGIWREEKRNTEDKFIFCEECYVNGKLVKKYNYIYFPLSKENKLLNGVIYYSKKDFIYKVIYKNFKIERVYFKVGELDYMFFLDPQGKLEMMAARGLLTGYKDPIDIPLYETYKNEINKILEVEN